MPLPSPSQKRRIIELVAYTQVFLDSMRDSAIYFDNDSNDDSERIEQFIADLISEQNRLLSTETRVKTKAGIEDYLNTCAMNIQQCMTNILLEEVQLLSEIHELSMIDENDINNEDVDDFEELRISGLRYHAKKKLEACNNTLEQVMLGYNSGVHKIYNMRHTINECYNGLDSIAESLLGTQLDEGTVLAVKQQALSVNLFTLSPEAMAQQILNIEQTAFNRLLQDDNKDFNVLLEANGKEYLNAMEKYVHFLPKADKQKAKDRCQSIKKKFQNLQKSPSDRQDIINLLNKIKIPRQSLLNGTEQQVKKGNGAVDYIKILINNLDQEHYNKLKFYEGNNAQMKADFLQEVVQMVKKYDSL